MNSTRQADPSENSPMYVGPRAPKVPVVEVREFQSVPQRIDQAIDLMIGKPDAIEDFMQWVEEAAEELRASRPEPTR